ncbi:MAG: M20/M25/M40 family metallo-hydrolase, partial [Myxococcota bacterium]
FGDDEEIGGEGAKALAQILENQEVGMVLDEGMAIVHDQMPGVKAPVAMIGISEKGYATLDLAVEQDAGHSSMPPAQTSVGILADAIVGLEASPFPARLQGPTRQLLEFVAPEADVPYRIAFANLWLFGGALEFAFTRKPTTAALLRTTTAATMFNGGAKENVLPREARATVNFRIAPGDTVDSVQARVRRTVDDARVTVSVRDGASDPSPVSSVDGKAFLALQRAIRQSHPDALVAPALTVGATDARHFSGVSDSVFRFSPERFHPGDTDRVHGVDERRSVTGHADGIRFYVRLIENVNAPDAL